MAIGDIILVIVNNLGITWPQLIVLITALGSLIFMAVEVRLGLMMMFLMFGIETVAFWIYGMSATEITIVTMALLATFVLMALSLLVTRSKTGEVRII